MKEAKKVTAENQKEQKKDFCENCRVKKAINHLARQTAHMLNFEFIKCQAIMYKKYDIRMYN